MKKLYFIFLFIIFNQITYSGEKEAIGEVIKNIENLSMDNKVKTKFPSYKDKLLTLEVLKNELRKLKDESKRQK